MIDFRPGCHARRSCEERLRDGGIDLKEEVVRTLAAECRSRCADRRSCPAAELLGLDLGGKTLSNCLGASKTHFRRPSRAPAACRGINSPMT